MEHNKGLKSNGVLTSKDEPTRHESLVDWGGADLCVYILHPEVAQASKTYFLRFKKRFQI